MAVSYGVQHISCLFIADFFLSVGLGVGRTDTPQSKMRKSISNERTFSASEDEALLFQKLGTFSVLCLVLARPRHTIFNMDLEYRENFIVPALLHLLDNHMASF